MTATTVTERNPVTPREGQARRWFRRVLIGIPLLALAIWTIYPMLMTLSISFKTKAD